MTFYRNAGEMEKDRQSSSRKANRKTAPQVLKVKAAQMLKENEKYGRIVRLQTKQGFYSVPLSFIMEVQPQ